MEDSKSILKSKTFWTNVIMAIIVPFLPEALRKPEYIGSAIGAVNILLRLISKDKVQLL